MRVVLSPVLFLFLLLFRNIMGYEDGGDAPPAVLNSFLARASCCVLWGTEEPLKAQEKLVVYSVCGAVEFHNLLVPLILGSRSRVIGLLTNFLVYYQSACQGFRGKLSYYAEEAVPRSRKKSSLYLLQRSGPYAR